MIQKITWMQLLIIGLISGIILISNISCTKVDYIITSRYIYKNNSSYDLTMRVYNCFDKLINQYNIMKNDSITIEMSYDEVAVPPFHYESLQTHQGDSIIIVIDNSRFITHVDRIENSDKIFEMKNYQVLNPSKRIYVYYYHFSNIDFENATPINL